MSVTIKRAASLRSLKLRRLLRQMHAMSSQPLFIFSCRAVRFRNSALGLGKQTILALLTRNATVCNAVR